MLIDCQTLGKTAALGVIVPKQLERLNVFRVALGETLQKGNLDIQFLFLPAGQILS